MFGRLRQPRHAYELVQTDSDSSADSDGDAGSGERKHSRFLGQHWSAIQGVEIIRHELQQVSESSTFSLVVAGIIMLQIAAMALQADYPVLLLPNCKAYCVNLWWYINQCFLVAFTGELTIRGCAGTKFFCGTESAWNWFDFSVVAFSWFLRIAEVCGMRVKAGAVVGILRAVRVLRILRAVRLVKQLGHLRLLLHGFIESLNMVLWVLVLLIGMIVIMAMLCTTLIGRHSSVWREEGQEEEIRMYFGSFSNSTITMFQYVTLDDWSAISRIVMEKMPWTLAAFLLYVIVAGLVIISLFTGVMAGHMDEVRKQEQLDEQRHGQQQLVHSLMTMHAAFVSTSAAEGHLVTRSHFVAMACNAELRAELEAAGLDHEDFNPGELFDSFDKDGEGTLSWDEFTSGLDGLRAGTSPKQFFKLISTIRRAAAAVSVQKHSQHHHTGTGAVKKELSRLDDGMERVERRLDVIKAELAAFLEEEGLNKD